MRFAIIGVAGYIAPRHLKAIKDIGGELIYAHDISDSVGILDKYSPECLFTTNYGRFKKWLYNDHIDYLVVCTPNYLHYKHICLGLGTCKEVICEKPLVIKKSHYIELLKYNDRINCIMQLRLSDQYKEISRLVNLGKCVAKVVYKVNRGHWYSQSWKGDIKKSGGIYFNIGVHIIDFIKSLGLVADLDMDVCNELDKHIEIGGKIIDLSKGFEDLHTKSYKQIIKGKGFRPNEFIHTMRYLFDVR
jgi:UDP-N-acetyl-2-amino-2-deoxyglucuronate dehydrogenase